MIAGAYILFAAALGQLTPGLTDQIATRQVNELLQLDWSDAEDRLQGSILPGQPHTGRPVEVSVHVGTFQGSEFAGPVTLTLRRDGENYGQTVTVAKGQASWSSTFQVDEPGPHVLDVSFRTTRLKLLHAKFGVSEGPLARWPWFVVLGLIALAALLFGTRSLFKARSN